MRGRCWDNLRAIMVVGGGGGGCGSVDGIVFGRLVG